jgi:hypothetical protein
MWRAAWHRLCALGCTNSVGVSVSALSVAVVGFIGAAERRKRAKLAFSGTRKRKSSK